LRILLADRSIDILSINETKLDDSINSCEVQIPGYEFIRRDRNRQGGGVGFYIKTSINFGVRSDLNAPSDLNCNLASAQYDLNTRRLCEISDLFGLQQLITEPTRITES
ncbi:unnamed protein product, partial [Porites lobata]